MSGNPVVMNLGQVSGFDTQQMFINVLKQGGSNDPLSPWSTTSGTGTASTGEEQYLQLDSNGYPTSLTASPIPSGGQVFNSVNFAIFTNSWLGAGASLIYPSGSYTFSFQGAGTIVFGNDVQSGSLATSSPNVSVGALTVTSTQSAGNTATVTLNVPTPSTGGIRLWITATTGGNTLKSFALCQTSLYASLQGGSIFHPNFLAALQTAPWKALRFMDTLVTNHQLIGGTFSYQYNLNLVSAAAGLTSVTLSNRTSFPWLPGTYTVTFDTGQTTTATSTAGSKVLTLGAAITGSPSAFIWAQLQTNWTDRALTSNLTYATDRGIPYEIAMALCNLVGADFWCNVPAGTLAGYWSSLASLIQSTLSASQQAVIEYSNEPWNGTFASQRWSIAMSLAYGASNGMGFIGAQTALMADSFATVFGNPGFDQRIVVSMPGQGITTSAMTSALQATQWVALGNTAPWLRTSASGQKTIKAGHIAPYYGSGSINATDFTYLTSQGDGGYSEFFSMLTQNPSAGGHSFTDPNTSAAYVSTGAMGAAARWVSNHVTALASFGSLPVYCYEGGWSFYDNSTQHGFLVSASLDSRMNALTQSFLQQCATAGTTRPCQYKFMFPMNAGQFEWGLCESSMQTFSPLSSAPPKLQGAAHYVAITVTTPDVRGLTSQAAAVILTNAGAASVTVLPRNTVYPNSVPAGTVLSQVPLQGTQAPSGFLGYLVTSTGLVTLPGIGDAISAPVNVVIGSTQ